MKRVLIIEGQAKQYRVPFYEKLRTALAEISVTLRVAYSDPPPVERLRRDSAELPSAYGVKVKSYRCLGNRAVWQPLLREVAVADLVVVDHGNKYLMNHLLLLCSVIGVKKVAFWGHGRNRQSQQAGLSEWLKNRTLNSVDWWFAYTAGTADYLVRHGVPRTKITNVQNSIDTKALRSQLEAISHSALATMRQEMGIPENAKVGLFCGRVVREKLPEFLIKATTRIKERLPEFELLVIGGGPEQGHFERAADQHPWFHYLGPRFGMEKVRFFRLADVFLIPSPVGLAILDSFAAGLPILTTNVATHGPEIEYLEENINGLMLQHEATTYAKTVVDVLTDAKRLHNLKEGAARSAEKYSIEAMTRNFAEGIARCLRIGASAVASSGHAGRRTK